MGPAQSSMLALVGTAGVASSKISSNVNLEDVKQDEDMANYARKIRDAKLKTAKNNAKISKLRLEKIQGKIKGGLK